MPVTYAAAPADAALERLITAGAGASAHLPTTPAVGYVCSYVPDEIILAAGLHPVRLGAGIGPAGPADASLQTFACSFARGLLDGLLTGRCGALRGVVFAHTCDSLRAAFEAWKVRGPTGAFVYFLNLPARVEGPDAVAYAASELARLARGLTEGVAGARPVTPEGLETAERLVASIRRDLGRLAAVRSVRPDLLAGSTLLSVARGASVVDRREGAELLAIAAERYEAAARSSPPLLRPRVLVSGGFLEDDTALRLIEEAGADVVADDLCLVGRALAFGSGSRGEDGGGAAVPATARGAGVDPFVRLAAAYLDRVPCPAKHPPARRFEFVLREAAANRVDGVVFLLQKFCDPHAFDYPALRAELEAAEHPCLLIEVERGSLAAGQARTRLEAFVERLGRREEAG